MSDDDFVILDSDMDSPQQLPATNPSPTAADGVPVSLDSPMQILDLARSLTWLIHNPATSASLPSLVDHLVTRLESLPCGATIADLTSTLPLLRLFRLYPVSSHACARLLSFTAALLPATATPSHPPAASAEITSRVRAACEVSRASFSHLRAGRGAGDAGGSAAREEEALSVASQVVAFLGGEVSGCWEDVKAQVGEWNAAVAFEACATEVRTFVGETCAELQAKTLDTIETAEHREARRRANRAVDELVANVEGYLKFHVTTRSEVRELAAIYEGKLETRCFK
ncbi:hypothetical protein HK101_001280 [Irineochytrium annulatum]|nr:hypothetical protein HK101_001280 [Irineochytrium annulatum]